MEIFLTRALQLILALSILVLIHEFGHYIFAKLFKIRVEKFYLFFPPAIFKLFMNLLVGFINYSTLPTSPLPSKLKAGGTSSSTLVSSA